MTAMGNDGALEARERLRRALRGYAGRRRTMAPARAGADAGPNRAAAGTAVAAAARRPAGAPAAHYDERGLRALAKEIKALISEDGRRGIPV